MQANVDTAVGANSKFLILYKSIPVQLLIGLKGFLIL